MMYQNDSQAQTQNEHAIQLHVAHYHPTVLQIRHVEIDSDPWFVAKDVCRCLEISDTETSLRKLDEDEKGTYKIRTLGGPQTMSIVNESGLYNLIFRSNKPEAKQFRKWVTTDVLPQIRKTGKYQSKRKLIRGVERLNNFLSEYLRRGDIKDVAEELHLSAHHVSRVKRGICKSLKVMNALMDRAKKNKELGLYDGYDLQYQNSQLDLFGGGVS